MAFPGQRFMVDLGSDDEEPPAAASAPPDTSSFGIPGLIGEIHERSPTTAPAPPKPHSTGFPAHRRRSRQSAFKQRREASSATPSASAPTTTPTPDDDKKAIGDENRRHLESMSADQIKAEREELMESMDTSLLERFLRRARVDSDDTPTSHPGPSASSAPPIEPQIKPSTEPTQLESVPESTVLESKPSEPTEKRVNIDDLPPSQIPNDLHPVAEFPAPGAVHFPTPPSQSKPMPNLDPSSPSFLSDLQTHYFPNISHDTSALSWLQPPSADADSGDVSSPYHPASEADGVHPSALRFSMLGTVLSPSTSLSLPTNLGLHHHGNDPHAAGYTIPELTILSRSTFPAQRCVAWQVMGRILFRLGKGEFGDRGSTLVEGIWFVIEQEGVVAGMLAEADGASAGETRGAKDQKQDQKTSGSAGGIGRHASATAWAVEGVWLWQKGGGGDRGVLKDNALRSQ